MNMKDYPTLHLDKYHSKGKACSKKGYGCHVLKNSPKNKKTFYRSTEYCSTAD
jgi:hypothetical protein